MSRTCKYHNTGFTVTYLDGDRIMWKRDLDNGEYYLILYQGRFISTGANGTGIRYCVAYHGGSENYWEFTTHEAAMKRVRELVYGVEKKVGKE